MKKCKKCGAYWQDNRSTCLDCGAVLDDALSEEEEKEVKEEMSDVLYDMSERTDDFYVSPKAKIFGILALIGAVAGMVLMVRARTEYMHTQDRMREALVAQGIQYVTSVNATVSYSVSSRCDRAASCGLIAFFALLYDGIELLFPKFLWELGTLKYRLFYNWDTTPSYGYFLLRKIMLYFFYAIGAGCLLYGYWIYV